MSNFNAVVDKVLNLTSNTQLQKSKMSVQTVQWEDMGRDNNSCWGSRIADMTLAVRTGNTTRRCPVIRRQNFTDETFDVPTDTFSVEEEDTRESSCESKETGLDMGNVQVGSAVDQKTRDENDKYVYPDTAKNFKIVRDPAYPVRVTFQYYRAADSAKIPSKEVDNIIEQLLQPIKVASAMVTGTSSRPTESAPAPNEVCADSVRCLTIQNIRDILEKEFTIALTLVEATKNADKMTRIHAENRYKIAKNRWQCLFQVHGCLISNISWEAPFKEFSEKKQYKSVEDCIQHAKSYGCD